MSKNKYGVLTLKLHTFTCKVLNLSDIATQSNPLQQFHTNAAPPFLFGPLLKQH